MLDELLYAERALRAGASGFVSKADAAIRVVEALRQLLRGEVYLSQRAASQIAARVARNPGASQSPTLGALTDRELQVFNLIAIGLSRHQIAQRLYLDVNTVETYRSRIKEKLHLPNALELRQYAIGLAKNAAADE
jgi:DNA-binding NarL/FixJ family response regulator